jgi:dolichol-phosphate mannosyltransferase
LPSTATERIGAHRTAPGFRQEGDQGEARRGAGQRASLSVVVAVYNEENVIEELLTRLTAVMASLPYDHEVIVVDDGSTDGTAYRLLALSAANPALRVLELSRNFGKEAATSAGIAHAAGDAVVLIDADLEHPPELIPQLVAKWEEGADVVVGVRNPRDDEGLVRRFSSQCFSYLMNKISDVPAPARATDYRLIDRAVAEEFTKLVEYKRLTRSLIDWLGFRRVYVNFDAGTRIGKSRYGYRRLIGSATSAIVAHSRLPLYVAGYLGAAITLLSLLLGAFVGLEQVVLDDPMRLAVSGTAMLSIMILFLDGVSLGCLGLVGVYVGTIREEVAGRPLYVIRRPRSDRVSSSAMWKSGD